jgi:hypothetical protein
MNTLNPAQGTGAEARHAWRAKYGLEYSAEFVPFSKSRNAKPAPKRSELSINWHVTLTCNGRAFTCDYSQGIGHLPENCRIPFNGRVTIEVNENIRGAVERGCGPFAGSYLVKGQSLQPPAFSDVLECLVLDAGALDFADFESWASNYGYEKDSRAAEAIYRTCLDQALKLRACIGGPALDELRAIPED